METDGIKNLIRHAKKYGADGVFDTAVEQGASIAQLCDVLKACEDAHDAQFKFTPKKRRGTIESRVNKLLGIEDTDEEGTPA